MTIIRLRILILLDLLADLGIVDRHEAILRNPDAPAQRWHQIRWTFWHFDFALFPPARNFIEEWTTRETVRFHRTLEAAALNRLIATYPRNHRIRRALENRRTQ